MFRSPTMILLLLAVATAAGCGDDASGSGPSLEGELTYIRSGGFAGVQEELVIQPDGAAELSVRRQDPRPFELSDEELDSLASVLEDTDLAGLPSDSMSERPVPDAFVYVVRYRGKEVSTDDPSIPAALQPLLSELGRLVEAHTRT